MGYRLTGIAQDGRIFRSKHIWDKVPGESSMINWGKKHDCVVVARFYPSRKGWQATDIRKARFGGNSSVRFWTGQVRSDRVYPSEDALVMHMLAILTQQPELDLT